MHARCRSARQRAIIIIVDESPSRFLPNHASPSSGGALPILFSTRCRAVREQADARREEAFAVRITSSGLVITGHECEKR